MELVTPNPSNLSVVTSRMPHELADEIAQVARALDSTISREVRLAVRARVQSYRGLLQTSQQTIT